MGQNPEPMKILEEVLQCLEVCNPIETIVGESQL